MRNLFLFGVLSALAVAAYAPLWDNDFVDFDDENYLTRNPHVKEGFTASGFSWVWRVDVAPYWMPLTWLSFQFDAHYFARRSPEGEAILSPAAAHGQNLFWHTANVCLLFGLLRRMTGRVERSFLVAALFAVHPMHVESVAWAAERKDVLSVFFGLLTLAAYFYYLQTPNWRRYVTMAAAYVLSLSAKPMLLTLPFVLLLLDGWPLGRTNLEGGQSVRRRLGQLVLEKMPLFLLAAIFAGATLDSRSNRGSIVSLDAISLPSRMANALAGYGWYLGTTFCPRRLCALYPHPGSNWSLTAVLAGAAALASISLVAWRSVRRRPWLFVGWFWFIGTLLPVVGLAQGGKQAWADRFCYWPHIGLFVAVVWTAAELCQKYTSLVFVSRFASILGILLLSVLTYRQVGVWRDTPTLWQHALDSGWESDQAHERLARHYSLRGRKEETNYHLQHAVRLQFQRLYPSSPPK